MRKEIAQAVAVIAAEVRPTAQVTLHVDENVGRDGWGVQVWFDLDSGGNRSIGTLSVFRDWLRDQPGYIVGESVHALC